MRSDRRAQSVKDALSGVSDDVYEVPPGHRGKRPSPPRQYTGGVASHIYGDPRSSQFQHEAERFNTDYTSQNLRERSIERERKQKMIEAKRQEHYKRDMARWSYMDRKDQAEKELQQMK